MSNFIRNNMMQGALRAGVCLFLLSGACVLSAQNQAPKASPAAATKKAAANPDSKFVMKEIKGFVFDAATQQPLAGVKVQALNNRRYTALTDDQGAYTIKVPDFVTSLYVAIDDYAPGHIAIKGDDNQNTSLYSSEFKSIYSDGTQLFAHTALDVKESSSLTVEGDIENKLNAAVRTINRGGMPAQGVAMFMNGINSLNANAQPLIVVDGVIWDMQYDRTTLHNGFVNNIFSIIDTEDIDNVQVLKNGTALYGAQGANGVILINTKRGKSMVTRINIRAYGGFELAPEKMSMMNASQYRNYVTEFLGTTYQGQEYFKNNTSVPSFMNEDPNFFLYPIYHNNTDWQDGMYKTSFTQNYRVNVEGGDDVAMYNLSLGYSESDAVAKQTDFSRLNIRFNSDIKLFKNLSTGLDIFYGRNAYNLRDNGWAQDYSDRNIASPNVLALIQSPFISPTAHYIYFEDGLKLGHTDTQYSGKDYTAAHNPYSFASQFGYEGYVNPYWILTNGDGDNKNFMELTQFALNVAPKYEIGKYLTISDRFSYIMNRYNEKYYLPHDGTPAKEVEGLGTVQSIMMSQFSKETSLFNDFRIDWQRHFGAHYLNVMGGFRLTSFSYNSSNITGYNNDQDKMPNVSTSLDYISYGGKSDTWTNLAYYLNADYNFKNKYFVNVGVTAESSSRFGNQASEGIKVAGVKWGLFPSVQLGWLISSEKWFDVKGIDYLKLVAGYEESGNDNVDYYAARTYFENGKFIDEATGLKLANIENPTIQWETTRRFNVGLQTSLLNNRLAVGVDYYWSKTSNLLTRKAVSDITGLKFLWANDGALKNTGVQVNTNAILINSRDWKWQAGFSIGHYRNEVSDLAESSINYITTYALDENGRRIEGSATKIHGYTSSIYGSNNVLTAVGHAAGVFYGYQTAGVFSTEDEASQAGKYGYLRYPTGLTQDPYRQFRAGDVHFVDQNGDGWINEADMVKIGDPNPDIYGNIYTSLSWKGLTLAVDFKYSLGNDIFNYQRSQLESVNGIYNQTTAVVNRWKYSGQVTDMPRAMASDNTQWVNNERFSDRWIEDGSYLKLKRVRLTYKFPFEFSWLQGLSVWGEANNVFTVSKYTGLDPEVSAGNSALYQGIDAGFLPQNRSFNLGVTINL